MGFVLVCLKMLVVMFANALVITNVTCKPIHVLEGKI